MAGLARLVDAQSAPMMTIFVSWFASRPNGWRHVSDCSCYALDGAQPTVGQRGSEVLAFDSKSGTKACSPIGLGGNVTSVYIVAAAWPVRSFHCSISNPEVSMAVRNRSGVVR